MAQIFPEWTNHVPRKLLIGLILTVNVIIFGIWYYFSPEFTDVGYAPKQPVPYSHQIHVQKLGLDCQYCHTSVWVSKQANVPPTQTCMNCHSQIKTDSEILIARSNNKIHPVVSMWNINLFKSIEIELNQNRRKIMTWVEKHNFTFVDFDYQTVDPFFNVNTIEDLKIAENFNQFNA